jgi:hypothetical protein
VRKGFLIDETPSRKKKKVREKGLPDSTNPIAKKEKVCKKGYVRKA